MTPPPGNGGGGREARLAWHFFLKILTPNKFHLHYLKCFKAKEDAERISKIKLADIASGVTIFLKSMFGAGVLIFEVLF